MDTITNVCFLLYALPLSKKRDIFFCTYRSVVGRRTLFTQCNENHLIVMRFQFLGSVGVLVDTRCSLNVIRIISLILFHFGGLMICM
jgi:hypothetical protein